MLQDDQRAGLEAVAPRPLAELLSCPSGIECNLGEATERRNFAAGEAVFLQDAPCEGLYLLLAGEFLRTSQRMGQKIQLQPMHPGDLVELAAVLGDGHHTYSLIAHSPAAALVLPVTALTKAFQQHPPLRMKLLEELGREVARAYTTLTLNRGLKTRRPRGGFGGGHNE
jgi:CRP-like cAMP-binding protein